MQTGHSCAAVMCHEPAPRPPLADAGKPVEFARRRRGGGAFPARLDGRVASILADNVSRPREGCGAQSPNICPEGSRVAARSLRAPFRENFIAKMKRES